MLFSEGHRHSAGGAAAVPRRHRRRQPRQRQHLHHGRGGPARRERAGEDPRPGEQAAGARAAALRTAAGRGRRRCRKRSRRTRTCCARIRIPAWARSRRTPAACSSTAPTTCARASTASRAICGTTTWSATRRRNDGLRRPLPRDRGQGEAARRHGRGAKGLLRRPRRRRRAINAYEAPALGALEQKPVPNAFPVRAGALLFPERDRPGLVPGHRGAQDRATHVPAGADGKTYTSDFTVLVRFVDQENQVVRKVSQHYEVTGPIGEIERAKAGRGDLLSRAGAGGRRLHDGDGRPRRAVGQVERPLLDGGGPGARIPAGCG